MDLSNQRPEKPFREWQIVGLILIALVTLGFGQATTKRLNNFPQPLPVEIAPYLGRKIRLNFNNGAEFEVELAQTEAEQIQGLSGRAQLGATEGMLFVYATTTIPSFWMKEMNFSLDIIWLDQNQKIADITLNISPATFPTTFSPKKPVQYVLEVPAGTAVKNNLQLGDLIHFSL
jgi:hypothetical protein